MFTRRTLTAFSCSAQAKPILTGSSLVASSARPCVQGPARPIVEPAVLSPLVTLHSMTHRDRGSEEVRRKGLGQVSAGRPDGRPCVPLIIHNHRIFALALFCSCPFLPLSMTRLSGPVASCRFLQEADIVAIETVR